MRLPSADREVRKMQMASGSAFASEQGICQLQINESLTALWQIPGWNVPNCFLNSERSRKVLARPS